MKIVTQPNESDLRDEVRGAVKCHFTHYESPHNLYWERLREKEWAQEMEKVV